MEQEETAREIPEQPAEIPTSSWKGKLGLALALPPAIILPLTFLLNPG
jgi:hypothetical protein